MPHLFIITGSNGAGKSTVGAIYFTNYIGEIFDGDKLFLQKRRLNCGERGLGSEAEHRVLVIMDRGEIKEFLSTLSMPLWIAEFLPAIFNQCINSEQNNKSH